MSKFSKLFIITLPALALFASVSLPAVHAGVIVNLGKLVIELGPDGRTTRELEIASTNDKPTEVSVFPSDWKQDETGAVEAVSATKETVPDSATGWIGVNPQRFVLKKDEKKIITVSIATPKGAMPLKEYRSMVFTETSDTRPAQPSGSGRELQVRVIGRIGTKIFIRNPQGLAKVDCEVTKIEEATQDGKRGLTIQTSNHGNVHVQSDASNLAFRNAAGVTVETLPIPPFSILPGHTRRVFFEFPELGKSKLEKGTKYNALAVIDYGGSDLVAGELELTY
jgi:P pilus assembly chaperone PapD